MERSDLGSRRILIVKNLRASEEPAGQMVHRQGGAAAKSEEDTTPCGLSGCQIDLMMSICTLDLAGERQNGTMEQIAKHIEASTYEQMKTEHERRKIQQ